ncbi:MAG: glycerophosphodiester phosphodiesterase [Pyrinomonadaceae bacterium]
MSGLPLIIAHRGASAIAPENTLAAFSAAIDAGVDGIEFDVQLARDGVPVVIHDTDLRRTAGVSERVADLTSARLGKTDVGSWFAPGFADESVPTLEQTLHLLDDFRGLIYIELKCELHNFKPLAAGVCDVIRDSTLLPQIVVKSFRLAAIPEVRRLLPGVQTAALFEPSIMTILRRREYIIAMAREFGAHQISLHHSLATPKLCALAAAADLPVTVWTVDAAKWLQRCRQRGIKALITNDPAKLIAARNSATP